MKKLTTVTLLSSLFMGASLGAFSLFNMNIDQEIKQNEHLIKKYEKAISKLKAENTYMLEEKAKNPQLYVKKSLYEDLNDKYIYRIKLNGAKTDSLNFLIKDNVVSLTMNMQYEEKNSNGYFYNSRFFSNAYNIPTNVDQEKIEHKIEGDYFTIVMPKKK